MDYALIRVGNLMGMAVVMTCRLHFDSRRTDKPLVGHSERRRRRKGVQLVVHRIMLTSELVDAEIINIPSVLGVVACIKRSEGWTTSRFYRLLCNA